MDHAHAPEFDWNTRRVASLVLVLLIPTAIGAALVALSGPDAAQHFNRCSTSGPSPLTLLMVSAAAGALGLAWPRRYLPFSTARVVPVAVQLVAQLWMAGQIIGC